MDVNFVNDNKGYNMVKVKEGDTARINYTGKLEYRTVFDTSLDCNPLEFTVGKDI